MHHILYILQKGLEIICGAFKKLFSALCILAVFPPNPSNWWKIFAHMKVMTEFSLYFQGNGVLKVSVS